MVSKIVIMNRGHRAAVLVLVTPFVTSSICSGGSRISSNAKGVGFSGTFWSWKSGNNFPQYANSETIRLSRTESSWVRLLKYNQRNYQTWQSELTSDTAECGSDGACRKRKGMLRSGAEASESTAETFFTMFPVATESYSQSSLPACGDDIGWRVVVRIARWLTRTRESMIQAVIIDNLFVEAPSSSKAWLMFWSSCNNDSIPTTLRTAIWEKKWICANKDRLLNTIFSISEPNFIPTAEDDVNHCVLLFLYNISNSVGEFDDRGGPVVMILPEIQGWNTKSQRGLPNNEFYAAVQQLCIEVTSSMSTILFTRSSRSLNGSRNHFYHWWALDANGVSNLLELNVYICVLNVVTLAMLVQHTCF